jgi:hypothetical protein
MKFGAVGLHLMLTNEFPIGSWLPTHLTNAQTAEPRRTTVQTVKSLQNMIFMTLISSSSHHNFRF